MHFRMAPPQFGERRSVVVNSFFTVPWDYPEERVPFDSYVKRLAERYEKDGWRFERVLRLKKAEGVALETTGGRRLYLLDVIFSRPTRLLKLEVRDRHVEGLLKTGKFKLLD